MALIRGTAGTLAEPKSDLDSTGNKFQMRKHIGPEPPLQEPTPLLPQARQEQYKLLHRLCEQCMVARKDDVTALKQLTKVYTLTRISVTLLLLLLFNCSHYCYCYSLLIDICSFNGPSATAHVLYA